MAERKGGRVPVVLLSFSAEGGRVVELLGVEGEVDDGVVMTDEEVVGFLIRSRGGRDNGGSHVVTLREDGLAED